MMNRKTLTLTLILITSILIGCSNDEKEPNIYKEITVETINNPIGEGISSTDGCSYWYIYGEYNDVQGWSLIKLKTPYFDVIDALEIMYKYKNTENFFIMNFIQITEQSYDNYIKNK